MTRNQSLFFRCLLFLAGAGVIILAFFLNKGNQELNRIDAFTWGSIALMYLVFFLPFFFSSIRTDNFSQKTPPLVMVWLGIVVYIAASVIVLVLLTILYQISLDMAIIIQGILLFLFAVDIYFAYFASSHVSRVAAEENALRQLLGEIKTKAQALSLSLNALPAEYEAAQKSIRKTLEDIRYIYPVKAPTAAELESKILSSLNLLSELCGRAESGTLPALTQESAGLQMLVNERKTLRS